MNRKQKLRCTEAAKSVQDPPPPIFLGYQKILSICWSYSVNPYPEFPTVPSFLSKKSGTFISVSFMRHLIVSRIQGADVVVCPMFIIMKGWVHSLSHNFLRVHSRVVRHENNDHMSWRLLDSYPDLKETHWERTVWTPPASPLLQWLLCFRPRLRER